jgi:outer membrane protein assembly factor BamB
MSVFRTWFLVIVLLFVWQAVASAQADDAAAVFEASGQRRGVFLVVSDRPDLAIAIAKAEPVIVHLLTASDADAARKNFVEAGVHGQVTVTSLGEGSLSLIDNTAAVSIIDSAGEKQVAADEVLRVTRPFGSILMKVGDGWKKQTKPAPNGVDNWGQYFYDGAMADLSQDQLAGPPHGIQWVAGNNGQGGSISIRVINDVAVMVEDDHLVARDAYSGMPLWQQEYYQKNRFSLLADEKRIYLVPQRHREDLPDAMAALDLRSGEQVLTYQGGVPMGYAGIGATSEDFDQLNNQKTRTQAWDLRNRALKTYDGVEARLDGGVLLQSAGKDLVAFDADSGKRLWQHTAVERVNHPMILDGQVYYMDGVYAPSWAYQPWPMGVLERLVCLDLKSGEPKWQWTWPKEQGEPPAAYSMTPAGDWLAFALRVDRRGKSPTSVALVKRDGSDYALADTKHVRREIGGGHSTFRMLWDGKKLWLVTGETPNYALFPEDIQRVIDPNAWKRIVDARSRPVGCTVVRATTNYLFDSLTTFNVDSGEAAHSNAARTSCDIGAIPAQGMSFIGPNHCFCAPYLPGFMAFHPRKFAGSADLERLEKGAAAPAPANGKPADWPMFMANAQRGNWTDAAIPAMLQQRWTINPAASKANDMIQQEWRDNWYTQGPVTPVSVAEGVAVVALIDEQVVMAFEPDTGHELWRTTVDGRIDSSPTIKEGVIYFGTRTGWVYALCRDTGALVWRFFASPTTERLVAYGQLESRWPLFGSLTVDDNGLLAVAGRHNDTDAGLWWWRLDPKSGQALDSGRLGKDALSTHVRVGGRDDEADSGANGPVVTDGKLVFLPTIMLQWQDGKLVKHEMVRSGDKEHHRWLDRFPYDILIPGNQGLMHDNSQVRGYKMSYFGLTQGRAYAYRGKDFLHAGGTDRIQHRGGSNGGRWPSVTRFEKLDAIQTVTPEEGRPYQIGAEAKWATRYGEADEKGFGALAVIGDSALVGFSVENRDNWKQKQEMPFRLRRLSLADGKPQQQDLPLPARPVLHGISGAERHVYVVCTDGSLVCFGE